MDVFYIVLLYFAKSFFGLTLKREKKRPENKYYQDNIGGDEREEYESIDPEILANGEVECTFDDEEYDKDDILDVLNQINIHHTCFKRSPKHTHMFRNIVLQKLKREILPKEWISMFDGIHCMMP
ncbi:uncharacterized protein SCDLUD_003795 [Saccharomycodes ludwigii]|uniref:uncharacterized protein n=1 Tax=Saccharomycodes ludwigii TaxID=36035 RepID=UPI001E867659|nr:hypothetical protein SCDLUD_005332 [Saccharomycodes ludwigii]XP_045934027.1 hypothetical protein SCDLUD_003061 [Saccharomycodes ludwigii]XP_045934722.1 hypothetical protein SCDLUD_003795 [Saccharomycodes ludwigii]KAH3898985.1 hypothetical protein SCDLUD_005332 [Saccharomycodes ludwigii]KAH3900094.1 hypothetical protein SCDLUD_003061 [Saccharomycodes ludwigii]KAH3900789.1 hypothetical protein SCDLUD_003795 [Saccharomycodes ludwigii]